MKEKANYPNNKNKNKNKIELFLAFWRKAKIRTCKQLKIAMIPWNFSFAGHPVVLPILGWATTARVPGMHSDTNSSLSNFKENLLPPDSLGQKKLEYTFIAKK